MKISLTDLHIIVDTLLASASIADSGVRLFKYTADSREGLAKKLIEEMSQVNLNIEVESE